MKTKDTFQKSKNDILSWYITCFSFTEYNNPKNIVKSYFGFNEGEKIPIGCLCYPTMVYETKQWYLCWYIGFEDGFHYVQSIEDHSVVKLSNCGINYVPKEFTDERFSFHYTDKQYDFNKKYQRYVHKYNYWMVGLDSIFSEDDDSVTLRFRMKFKNNIFENKYPSWKKLRMKDVIPFLKEIENEEREIRDKLSLELLDSVTKKAKSIHK